MISAMLVFRAVSRRMPEWVMWSRSMLLMTMIWVWLRLFALLVRRWCRAQVLSRVRAGRLRALLLVPIMV